MCFQSQGPATYFRMYTLRSEKTQRTLVHDASALVLLGCELSIWTGYEDPSARLQLLMFPGLLFLGVILGTLEEVGIGFTNAMFKFADYRWCQSSEPLEMAQAWLLLLAMVLYVVALIGMVARQQDPPRNSDEVPRLVSVRPGPDHNAPGRAQPRHQGRQDLGPAVPEPSCRAIVADAPFDRCKLELQGNTKLVFVTQDRQGLQSIAGILLVAAVTRDMLAPPKPWEGEGRVGQRGLPAHRPGSHGRARPDRLPEPPDLGGPGPTLRVWRAPGPHRRGLRGARDADPVRVLARAVAGAPDAAAPAGGRPWRTTPCFATTCLGCTPGGPGTRPRRLTACSSSSCWGTRATARTRPSRLPGSSAPRSWPKRIFPSSTGSAGPSTGAGSSPGAANPCLEGTTIGHCWVAVQLTAEAEPEDFGLSTSVCRQVEGRLAYLEGTNPVSWGWTSKRVEGGEPSSLQGRLGGVNFNGTPIRHANKEELKYLSFLFDGEARYELISSARNRPFEFVVDNASTRKSGVQDRFLGRLRAKNKSTPRRSSRRCSRPRRRSTGRCCCGSTPPAASTPRTPASSTTSDPARSSRTETTSSSPATTPSTARTGPSAPPRPRTAPGSASGARSAKRAPPA